MALDNTKTHCQAQPGSRTNRLGGEKRLTEIAWP
jgi:hypothetical protein